MWICLIGAVAIGVVKGTRKVWREMKQVWDADNEFYGAIDRLKQNENDQEAADVIELHRRRKRGEN